MKRTAKNSVIYFLAIAAVLMLIFSIKINSQDNTRNIETVMHTMLTENNANVLQPYADALSSNMNSGLIASAKINKGLSLYFGIKASGTYINADNKVVEDANKTLNILPVSIPQVQIGYFGTQVTVRYLPSITMSTYGAVSMFGIGIRNSFTSYFKKSPVDVALGLNLNNFNYEDSKGNDMVNTSSVSANLQVSKTLDVFTFYTGVQYESSNLDLNLKYDGDNKNYKYENDNKFRSAIGLNIGLGVFNINCDYSFGKTNSISAGMGFAV